MKIVIAEGEYTEKYLPQPGRAIAQNHRMAGPQHLDPTMRRDTFR